MLATRLPLQVRARFASYIASPGLVTTDGHVASALTPTQEHSHKYLLAPLSASMELVMAKARDGKVREAPRMLSANRPLFELRARLDAVHVEVGPYAFTCMPHAYAIAMPECAPHMHMAWTRVVYCISSMSHAQTVVLSRQSPAIATLRHTTQIQGCQTHWPSLSLLQLYEDQYHDITTGLVYRDLFDKWCRYRKWRPVPAIAGPATRAATHASFSPRAIDARAWWQYAGKCVSFDIAQTRSRFVCSWDMVKARNELWRRCIELSVRRLGAGLPWVEGLEDTETEELLRVFGTLGFERLHLFAIPPSGQLRSRPSLSEYRGGGGTVPPALLCRGLFSRALNPPLPLHLSPLTSHLSPSLSPPISHLSSLTSHLSPLARHPHPHPLSLSPLPLTPSSLSPVTSPSSSPSSRRGFLSRGSVRTR